MATSNRPLLLDLHEHVHKTIRFIKQLAYSVSMDPKQPMTPKQFCEGLELEVLDWRKMREEFLKTLGT